MKKISVLILLLTMLMSLCACNGGDQPYSSATSSDISEKELQELLEQVQEEQSKG